MANFQITNVRIRIKQDTKDNWNHSSLIPLVGEICLATDTGELRYGDGTNTWTGLSNICILSENVLDAISIATNTGNDTADRTADAGKLVKTISNGEYKGKIDPNLVVGGQSLLESNKIQAELLTNTLTGNSPVYVQATGTYVEGVTYYTDATGKTQVDTSEFEVGVTDVSNYYIESQSTTEVNMASKIETYDKNGNVIDAEYSQNYVLNTVNI